MVSVTNPAMFATYPNSPDELKNGSPYQQANYGLLSNPALTHFIRDVKGAFGNAFSRCEGPAFDFPAQTTTDEATSYAVLLQDLHVFIIHRGMTCNDRSLGTLYMFHSPRAESYLFYYGESLKLNIHDILGWRLPMSGGNQQLAKNLAAATQELLAPWVAHSTRILEKCATESTRQKIDYCAETEHAKHIVPTGNRLDSLIHEVINPSLKIHRRRPIATSSRS